MLDSTSKEIQRHLLSVHATLHPEGLGIAQLAASGVAMHRILALYPLVLQDLPGQIAAYLSSWDATYQLLDQVLDEKGLYSDALNALCEAVPNEQRGGLLVPVISAAKQPEQIAALLQKSPLSKMRKRWPRSSQEEVLRAAVTSVGESMWLASNWQRIEVLVAEAPRICWVISTLEDALRQPA